MPHSPAHPHPEARAIAAALAEAAHVVLTTHVTPDGDGLGSALALCRHLRRLGKDANVINCSSAPHDLRWLYAKGEFHVYNAPSHERRVVQADVIVATDIGGADRMGKMLDPIRRSKGTRIVLDHHIYDNDIFDLALIEAGASSTSEITYELIRLMGGRIDLPLAEPLYVGIVSDTGGFAYSATTPRVHTIAAELLAAGVDPHHVWRQLHCQVPHGKMRFLGLMLARLSLENEGQLVWTSVDQDFLHRNETQARDAFEVVNHILRVKGVEIGAFFMEISKIKTKVSLRSAGRADVCEIAKGYGGGGHTFAAGCTVDLPLNATIPKVLTQIRAILSALEARD